MIPLPSSVRRPAAKSILPSFAACMVTLNCVATAALELCCPDFDAD